MKVTMKKLVLLLMITMTIMFVMVALASAGSPRIQGQYTATASGTCILAFNGFDPAFVPKPTPAGSPPNPVWYIQTFTNEGVWTFNRDGTGSLTGQTRMVMFPYTVVIPPPGPGTISFLPSTGVQELSFDFHYSMEGNKITITADENSYFIKWIYGPSTGKEYHLNGFIRTGDITPDGKTITLNGGVPDVMTFVDAADLPPSAQIVCNASTVLVWQNK